MLGNQHNNVKLYLMNSGLTKPPIINSTSGYLSRIIRENICENGGSPSTQEVLGRIREEGPESLFIPSSNFENAGELLTHYNIFLEELPEQDRMVVAEAYMEELKRAKRDNRYFCRNPYELKERYGGNKIKALQAISQFLESHGYKIITKRGEDSRLFDWYMIEDHILHTSEMGDPEAYLGKIGRSRS